MFYHHLTIEERICISKMSRQGDSFREIARVLGRNPSTISREYHRNFNDQSDFGPDYYPNTAQWFYKKRKKLCHKTAAHVSNEVLEYIEEKLNETWSPEQIVGYKTELKLPSFKTIYRWIDQGILCEGNKKVLRRKGKPSSTLETRGKFNTGAPIRKRDKSVYKRLEYSHWEADTMVSGRKGKTNYCFVTLAERKSRLYLAFKVPNRTAEVVTKAVIKMLEKFPDDLVKTITFDRGKEFAGYEEIEEKLNCKTYFADPYCAWQRGTNENSNGLLREFFPKGSSLRVSDAKLEKAVDLINHRPRKVNRFIPAIDLINTYLNCCT